MFRLELSGKNFDRIEFLDREYMDLSWSFAPVGGCGEFSFSLPRELYEEKALSGEQNIKIYEGVGNGTYTLWYQGVIENKMPGIDTIDITGHGYQTQLSRVLFSATYTDEVSVIVQNILDNYIVPNTGITYVAANIGTTSFTPDALEFKNESCLSALEKLASLAGGVDWGVDKNRSFYFLQRSVDAGLKFTFDNDIIDFSEDITFGGIINQAIVQGIQSGGTYYESTYNHAKSQQKYNLRSTLLSNSSVSTDAVASQFATSYFNEFSRPVRRVSLGLVNYAAQLEGTLPIPLVYLVKGSVTYGERKYGTFLYSGKVNRRITRINYNVTDEGNLKIGLELGQNRPTYADNIAELEYKLDQQQRAAA